MIPFFFLSYAILAGQSAEPAAAVAAPAAKAVPAAKAAPAADDMDDMFGGDDDDEEVNDDGETKAEAAATVARQARMAHAKQLKDEKDAKDGKTGAKKDKPAEKSLIVLEVKPWEADTNLEEVWKLICQTEQEGLTWGEKFKLEPVAYGIMKLVMTCTIVDSMILMDDVTDKIEALEEFVQSVTIASFNKI